MNAPVVMHGGCFDCGSRTEAVLESRLCLVETTERGMTFKKPTSIALCSDCREKRGCEKR